LVAKTIAPAYGAYPYASGYHAPLVAKTIAPAYGAYGAYPYGAAAYHAPAVVKTIAPAYSAAYIH
jgi:hypothetical protein